MTRTKQVGIFPKGPAFPCNGRAKLWHNPRLANDDAARMDKRRIEDCVERLCQKGCKALWTDIERMDRGRVLPELAGLDAQERAEVLREIKSIMAVYKDSCSL